MTDFSDLLLLAEKSPDAFVVALSKLSLEEITQFFTIYPEIRMKVIELDETLSAGDDVTVNGFKVAYREFYGGRELPYVDIPVAEAFVWAFHNKKGVMYESWRGKGKSTFFAAWCPYVIGCRPVGSTVLVRVNGPKAQEMGKLIADLIETNEGWKKLFPMVIPDMRAGWSVDNGFQVMDLRVTGPQDAPDFEERYAKWRMMCFADHLSEKSLICVGIESGSIIGLHPTNGAWFDDLHDELNTRSQAEMKKVVDIAKGNVIPTWFGAGGSPTLGVFCTPWSKNPPDVYQVFLSTGLFKHIKMPIFVEDPDGEPIPAEITIEDEKGVRTVAIDPDWAGKKIRPTWPEKFPVQKIAEMIHAFKTRFGQMCLCNVDLSKPKNMIYQDFLEDQIRWDQWEMTTGVDPVGTVDGVSTGDGISHFAMANILKTPYNSLVIADGLIEKIDALEGERRILENQRRYMKTYRRASIEKNGSGAIFIGMITRNKGVKYAAHEVSELGHGTKRERQYRFLQPLFRSGALVVSTADTPFLNAVREYCDNFPHFDRDSYLWDVGDSIAIAVLDIPEIWTNLIREDAQTTIWGSKTIKKTDPFDALLQGRR